MICKACPNYKFESGPSDYCPSSYGVMYCTLLHKDAGCFTAEENAALEKTGSPDNCPLNKEKET